MFTIGVILVGGLILFGGVKASSWWEKRSEQKMLRGAMLAEIEEDVARRRPTRQEIWDAEREIEEDLSDIVSK